MSSAIPTDMTNQTYEQTAAAKSIQSAPDPIHYNASKSYRNAPYRQLLHQQGTIGNFTVRLLEAKDLKRSHWSVLGLGPVKHLGLSKAHGEVSSYANIKLGFSSREDRGVNAASQDGLINDSKQNHQNNAATVAVASAVPSTAPITEENFLETPSKTPSTFFPPYRQTFQSSVIPFNSSPKWPTVQTTTNKSLFHIPLLKGSMPTDGMKIILNVLVREERSAMDSLMPGVVQGSNILAEGALGAGNVDITELVLRGYGESKGAGFKNYEDQVDVWDVWLDLSTGDGMEQHSKGGKNEKTGKVRLLVSYEPNGLNPQRGDLVALESFARKSLNAIKSFQIIPSLHPLKVVDARGEYLLVNYDIITQQPSMARSDDGHPYHNKANEDKRRTVRTGSVRLHRNTVFVIERTSLVDSVVNLALKPADIAMSTPIGRDVVHATSPYVEAAADLVMPAVLSGRLLIEAAKVGGSATFVGLKTATAAVIESQDPERRRRATRHSPNE